MAKTGATPAVTPPSGKKKTPVSRIVLMILLGLLVLTAIPYFLQVREYQRALALYDGNKFQEGNDLLETLRAKLPISLILGGKIRTALGLCKAELASDIAMKDQSLEGYTKALALLQEASALAGPTQEIQRRIKEYEEYKQKLEKSPESQPTSKPAQSTPGQPEVPKP